MDLERSSTGDIIPEIIPCCYGKEVGVEPKIISTGLSAISIKRTSKKKGGKTGDAKLDGRDKSNFQNRNSFFNLHRPEMTKINWVSTSPRKIEQFFHDHANKHGPFCAYLHDENASKTDDLKCLLPPNEYQYNEEEFLGVSGSMGNSILLKTCSMQLSDDDLSPSSVCHRSRAEFCVTIGGKEASRSKRTISQTMGEEPLEPGDSERSLPTEHQDSLTPLGKTKGRVVQKAARPTLHSSSPMNSLEQLASVGQSKEVATVSATSGALRTVSYEDNRDDGNDSPVESPSFRSILEPQDQHEESLPNVITEDDEVKIRALQKQREVAHRVAGGGNYEMKKPPVTSAEAKKKRTSL